ncbi:MAG: outer membrane beta-barrel family protein, partial [Saprospiraceae bacterium]
MAGVFNFATDQNYDVLAAGRDTLSYGKRLTDPKNNFQNNSIQTDWKKTYARKGESLTVSGVFGWGTVSNVADWTTTGYDKLGQSLPDYPELVNISGANASRQTTFQADYVRPINDSTKLETGLRSFWSGKDQEYFYHPFNRETSAYELDPTFSQDSRINETVNAAYLSVSSRWKYGISYQAGLRFEQSSLNGDSKLDSVPSFGYHYPTGSSLDWWRSFFPSVYVSKKLDASSELGLNFSRKIGRPNYRQLMPGIQANDKQNVQYGNPDLQPEFVDLTELNYNQVFGESNWLSSLYFSNETNTL